ncbi:MAG TPA: hypothetical protein VJ719_00500 [Chthoniobacterales bacterium]|nr:hypothetical protein [Chthoniobacterales bacterium]
MNNVQKGAIESFGRHQRWRVEAALLDLAGRCEIPFDGGLKLFAPAAGTNTTTIVFMPNGRAAMGAW